MKIDGQCHCGAIAFEAELDPDRVGVCHCADCQSLSASVFRTIAVVLNKDFRITRGTPKEYVKLADSGRQRVQAFCGDCGSGLYATDVGDAPEAYNIRAGTIRQRAELVPKFEVWRQSALGWLPDLDIEKKFEQGPV